MGRRKIIYFVVFGFFLIFFLILFHLESHRLNTIQCNCGSPSATSIFSSIFCGKKKIFFFFFDHLDSLICEPCVSWGTPEFQVSTKKQKNWWYLKKTDNADLFRSLSSSQYHKPVMSPQTGNLCSVNLWKHHSYFFRLMWV